jgi:vacuolar protein sorting-associated protein 45
MVSLVLSQSEILNEEVYLFEKITQPKREAMTHLQAICFFRPTKKTLESLKLELRNPKYGAYYIFFTNTVPEDYLKEIAFADEIEVIKEVHEFYVDYYAVNKDAWHLNLPKSVLSVDDSSGEWSTNLNRITDGLSACLLSLRIRPHVRAQRSSSMAIQIAQSIKSRIENSSTFHVGQTKSNPPLLLIVDRNEDPVTPLLTAWTYQAMLHQLLGMHNNRIDLSNVDGIREELKQIVVSSAQDEFYRQHMVDDLGDMGLALKEFVDSFKEETNSNNVGKLNNMEDIKRFVEKYPEFRKTSANVTKHVTLMGELQRHVQQRKLQDVSLVEQELACHDDHADALGKIFELLRGNISSHDALRVVLLYALRYASNADTRMDELVAILSKDYQIPDDRLICIRYLLAWANKRTMQLDLMANQNWLLSVGTKLKRGLVGIPNVFTQHEPLVKKILTLLKEQKLDVSSYPYVVGQPTRASPTEVIVFVVGGITFEEVAAIHKLNAEKLGYSYIIGGTSMVRPDDFINDILSLKH